MPDPVPVCFLVISQLKNSVARTYDIIGLITVKRGLTSQCTSSLHKSSRKKLPCSIQYFDVLVFIIENRVLIITKNRLNIFLEILKKVSKCHKFFLNISKNPLNIFYFWLRNKPIFNHLGQLTIFKFFLL